MDKKYYFLAGLFRSGNTLLSAILNQNPELYSSPLSPLYKYIQFIDYQVSNHQSALLANDTNRSVNVIRNIFDNYYYDVEKPVVIDRYKNWMYPDNIDILKKYITQNPKIVFTTRPVLEIITSYINVYKNGLLEDMKHKEYVYKPELSVNDNIAEHLMSDFYNFRDLIDGALYSIDNPENFGMIHIVRYENLINNPEETLNSIYDFLEMPRYRHDFNNIEKIEKENYQIVGFPEDLHEIRRSLERSSLKVEDCLSPFIIEKYKDFRYF